MASSLAGGTSAAAADANGSPVLLGDSNTAGGYGVAGSFTITLTGKVPADTNVG